ncbi:ABC transporter substrate-binding protein [Naumannella huperziae]
MTTHPALTRRRLLGLGLGAAAIGAVPALGACTGTTTPPGAGSPGATGSATFGSNASDPVPRAAYAAVVEAYSAGGNTVTTNTVPHNDFQNNISTYLQGSPDDVFTWFAGYRMQYYAEQGVLADVDDVWAEIGSNFSPALAAASTGLDGKKYLVPNYNYPWVVHYRKSLFADRGYQVPTTWDEFVALCKQIQGDKIIPIEFTNKEGWPAFGMFDYLNMRTNGYQAHADLCAHRSSWDSPDVAAVFDGWREILPFQNPGALGMTWQDGAANLGEKKSAMYLIGTFVTQEYADNNEVLDDIDFFPFPAIGDEGQSAVEAPIDGLLLSRRGGENPVARDFAKFVGTPQGQDAYSAKDTSNLPTAAEADRSYLTPMLTKAAELIAGASAVSQFFDRDALPAMASNVLAPALQEFTRDGKIDLANIEAQAAQLYAAQ